jgi:hypothetical protein
VRHGRVTNASRAVFDVRPASHLLLVLGVLCLVVVLLTHVAERLHVFPSMGWGLPNSPGHYLDLTSAILSGMSVVGALALAIAARCKRDRR